MTEDTDLDWDAIDRAVAKMERGDLEDVRASSYGVATANIDFNHPTDHPMFNRRTISSSVEVGTESPPNVNEYTIRFPGIVRGPNHPARDAIAVATEAAADKFDGSRTVEVVNYQRPARPDTYQAHIRGADGPTMDLSEFVSMVIAAQEEWYERIL